MWRAFLPTPSISELADFAILLLGISVNQAGLERSFSDLKIKKTCLRNQMRLPTLEKMAKVRIIVQNTHCAHSHMHWQVGADIRTSHKEAGFVDDRLKQQNHDKANVATLLAMPQYADVLDDDGEINDDEVAPVKPSGLVKGRADWRKEMAKWVCEARTK